VSHRAAAAYWELAGIEHGLIEITCERSQRPPAGIKLHVLPAVPMCDVDTLRGIPVTNVSRTLLDLAGVVPEESVEIALDDALVRRLTSIARLRWRIDELCKKGRPGCRILRSLLEVRGPGMAVPESVLETKFRRLLRKAGLPSPVLQHPYGGPGRAQGWLDFSYPDKRIVMELDGRRWHFSRITAKRDVRKANSLNIRGWTVLRFTWEDVVNEGPWVVQQVREAWAAP
jgi:hypothetical protein